MQGGISDLNANSVFASALFCTSGHLGRNA